MNLKKLNNIFLTILSILIGVLICEFVGRNLGLGNPLLYKKDTLIGYRLRANQNKKRFDNSQVNTDYEGFRFDPNQIKDSNPEIIIFVGDSVTYGGSSIDDSELFSSLYCKNNRNLLCLNAAVNAWGTYNMGRFIDNFSIYSERIPDKFILVILPGDDLRNLTQLRSIPYWSRSPKNPKAIFELVNYSLWKYGVPFLRSKGIENNRELIKNNEVETRTKQQSWNDLYNYIISSKYNIEIIVTPPKKWFEKSKEYKSEINSYDNYLSMLSKIPNVTKTCNLYYFIKDVYSANDYLDSVHLSKDGHAKWVKKIKSCSSE